MEGKTPPAQVAQCQDHLGHKYRSGMQQPNTGSTRARSALRWCPCASCIWLLHHICSLHKGTTIMQIMPLCYLYLVAASRSYTCTQDGLDTVQLALVVFFLPPTSENTSLALMVVITCCNLRWWCFSLEH